MKKISFFALLLLALVSSCVSSNESGSTTIDTPTSGQINISVDETLRPIADAEVDVFLHTYTNAKINVRYRAESECVRDLFTDSSQAIFIGRSLNVEEMTAFKNMSFNPPHAKVCTDAIALVVHPKSRDTAMTYEQAVRILRGDYPTRNVVFDNKTSGTVSYILDLTQQKEMPRNAYAAKSNLEAVNYVAEHPDAVGVIGWSWISDSDDPKTKEYLSKVRLVSLGARDPKSEKGFFKPYQLNLADGKYPLSREVQFIQRERRNGLAAGFMAFVYSEIGQLIIQKAGLLPANQSERWIEIKTGAVGKMAN